MSQHFTTEPSRTPKRIMEKGENPGNQHFLISEKKKMLLYLNLMSANTFNPFPHNDAFWRPWETSILKTLWEKEKLLVTSNFSFSHSVFFPFG